MITEIDTAKLNHKIPPNRKKKKIHTSPPMERRIPIRRPDPGRITLRIQTALDEYMTGLRGALATVACQRHNFFLHTLWKGGFRSAATLSRPESSPGGLPHCYRRTIRHPKNHNQGWVALSSSPRTVAADRNPPFHKMMALQNS